LALAGNLYGWFFLVLQGFLGLWIGRPEAFECDSQRPPKMLSIAKLTVQETVERFNSESRLIDPDKTWFMEKAKGIPLQSCPLLPDDIDLFPGECR
jgi:hypothetical protein